MKQNIMYMGLALLGIVGFFGTTQVYAESPSADYSHSQGDEFQCATGPTQQMECQMLNAMKLWFPQIVQQLEWQNGNLTKQIQNQNTIIQNQQKEIDVLKSMVQTTPQTTTQQKTTSVTSTHSFGNVTTWNGFCKMTSQGVRC